MPTALMTPEATADCPVCGENLASVDYHPAYMAEADGGWPVGGTVIVTGEQVASGYEPHLRGHLLSKREPFPAEDYWEFGPCRHTFTGKLELIFTVTGGQ